MADALPLLPDLQELHVSRPQCLDLATINQEVEQDPKFQKIKGSKEVNSILHPKYQIHQGTPSSALKLQILRVFHDSAPGEHTGFHRTYKRISQDFHLPWTKHDFKNFIDQCHTRQEIKFRHSPAGLLQPLSIAEKIWEEISLDFNKGLPLSHGFNCIMVVAD